MTLSNQQREALYAHVTNILSESIRDTGDPSTVDAFMGEVASVMHRSISDVVETWNQKACGVMCRLPMELLAQSFGWLDPPERAKVTGVSRYFRSVALAHPSLSAQIRLHNTIPRQRLKDALVLLLERSGRATLDVDIYAQEQDVTALLARHVSRMRTLIIDRTHSMAMAWIFEQPAPALEVLKVPHVADGSIVQDALYTVLPSHAWAPLLRRLELPSTFVLPAASGHFDRVTYFNGHMTARWLPDTDARRLFEIFPSLEALKLSFYRDSSVTLDNFPNTHIPRTLMKLSLYDEGDGENISSLLALWHGHPFRVVTLQSRFGRLAIPALKHMRSVEHGPWHIELQDYSWVIRTEREAVYTIDCYGLFHNLHVFLETLRSIVALAPVLVKHLTETLNLPSLHSVTLRGSFQLSASAWESIGGRLCVPRLQTLRLEPQSDEYDDQWQEEEVRDCLQYTGELLRRLTLEDGSERSKIPRLVFSEVARPYIAEEFWACIYERASSVYIEDELLWQEETNT